MNFWKTLIQKETFINNWWLILSLFGLNICILFPKSLGYFLIGILLFFLSILTYKTKNKYKKISYSFSICLLLIFGIKIFFNSTVTFFAFLVSTTILILLWSKNNSKINHYISFLIIPAFCDIFAGLNKLIPGNQFLYSDLLLDIINNNLFVEPNFIINNINLLKTSVPVCEIFVGSFILVNPKKAFYFLIPLHLSIAFFASNSIDYFLLLFTYALFLIFCLRASINIEEIYLKRIDKVFPLKIIFFNTSLFFKNPSMFLRNKSSPLILLGILQFIIPSILLILRFFYRKIYMYGFGWQMFS